MAINAPSDGDELKRILAEDIEKLTPAELKIRLKALERKIALAPSTITTEKHMSDLSGLGPDDDVVINMCTAPMGDLFCLGSVKYPPGRLTVKKRVAEQLQYMVSCAYQVERERLLSRSNPNNSGMLRGEDQARIERFQQIMKED